MESSPKFQLYDVASVDWLMNFTVSRANALAGSNVKAATGLGPLLQDVISSNVAISEMKSE